MTMIGKFELPEILAVCIAIIDDVHTDHSAKLEGEYVALAPDLFGTAKLSVTLARASLSDATAIKASGGNGFVNVMIGAQSPTSPTDDTLVTLCGALCHELVHERQRLENPTGLAEAIRRQSDWEDQREESPSPEDWFANYYSTEHELAAHAEQIACELWVRADLERASVGLP